MPVTGSGNPPCFITIFSTQNDSPKFERKKIPVYFRYSLLDTIEREGRLGSVEQIVEFEEF